MVKDVDKIDAIWYFLSMQTPFRLNDLILVVVVILSMIIAIVFPDFGSQFKVFPIYCLMINFFLSYLSIDLADVWKALKGHYGQISAFTIMKLALLPIIIYFLFRCSGLRLGRPAFDRCFHWCRLSDDFQHGKRQQLSRVRGRGHYFCAGSVYTSITHKGCRGKRGRDLFSAHAQDAGDSYFYSHYYC